MKLRPLLLLPFQFQYPGNVEQILRNNEVQLFDLKNDPIETHNLALDPEKNRDLILRMNALLAYGQGSGLERR